jgi:serralysin
MPTVSQVTQTPSSGYTHIDALLGGAIPWNFIGRSTINFSFDLGASADPGGTLVNPASISVFNAAQQVQVRAILAYVAQVTGIAFVEVGSAAQADLHFANADVLNRFTSQNASSVNFTTVGSEAAGLTVDAWVYLDVVDDAYDNLAPTPGGDAYDTLLHEIGHVLGMKHPDAGSVTLAAGTQLGGDNSLTTVMSGNYTIAPRTEFGLYDLAALQWLYGGDGLGGRYGVGAAGMSLVGSVNADTLHGGAGADLLSGSLANDVLDGGGGIDVAVYYGARSGYTVKAVTGGFLVTDNAGSDGADTLVNVERLQFADAKVAIDITGNGGMAYRLYQAAFDRAPDVPGLGFQMRALDDGWNIAQVAQNFIDSPEFSLRYGSLNDTQFVTQLYANVLHRAPDAGGLAFHTGNLASGFNSRANVLVGFSESPENQANVIGVIQDGMLYSV